MSLGYSILYGVGFTPWDNDIVPDELVELVRDVPRGRALDVGCGTGTQSVWLAKQGFDVVGVDAVKKPIARARVRAEEARVSVRFVVGDLAAEALDLGDPFSLVLDYGCFHSVPDRVRDGLVRAYARYTERDARIVLFAFAPRRGPGPKGASREELEQRLSSEWTLEAACVDESTRVPKPLLAGGRPTWYAWRRR